MADIATAGELREYLAQFPADMKIILSKDGEGNDHSPLAEADEVMYRAETTWSGEIYPTPEEIIEKHYDADEDGAPDDAERVIVLWPTN